MTLPHTLRDDSFRQVEELSNLIRGNLLHNASMASGELFHSNMLAFLLEQTRPEDNGRHEVLDNLLSMLGLAQWPSESNKLGLPRLSRGAVQDAAAAKGLPLAEIKRIDDAFVDGLNERLSESPNAFTLREVRDFDLTVNLHDAANLGVSSRWRGKAQRGQLEALSFSATAPRFTLYCELKVKSVADDIQIAGYLERLRDDKGVNRGQWRLLVLSLFPYEPGFEATENLIVKRFSDYEGWLTGLVGLELPALSDVVKSWLTQYRDYVRLLRQLSEALWTLIEASHGSDQAYGALDQLLAPALTRCRMYASYQKTRASYMAAKIGAALQQRGCTPVASLRADTPWTEMQPGVEVYSSYSNGKGLFGAGLRHNHDQGEKSFVEIVGVQVQADDYRRYVSWDWKRGSARRGADRIVLRRVDESDVMEGETNAVDARWKAIASDLAHGNDPTTPRNFGHRWRGEGSKVEHRSGAALVGNVVDDVLQMERHFCHQSV